MQEDNPWRHSETGDLGKGLKKKIVHRLFLAVAITLHNFTHILLHCIHIFIFYYALILSGFLHYNILTTFHIGPTRLFIYVRLLLFNLLFLESIHSLLFRHIIIFLNHGQYTPRGPDH